MSAARRTVVKVCGLTRAEDAAWAIHSGADWLGFILKGDSPRLVAPEHAATITAALPGVTAVAVMVAVGPDEALDLAKRAGAVRVQLHRVDPASWPTAFPLSCAFAMSVSADGAVLGHEPGAAHLVLLDTADAQRAGGTGRVFPWQAARPLAGRRDVMLAGGLDGGNVAVAIEALRPFGVDASSRLESAPGVKDPERVRRYVAAVREWDDRERHERHDAAR